MTGFETVVATTNEELLPGTPLERIRAWNEALLEELLPMQIEPGTPVLLACDAEAVRAAGARLVWLGDDAEREFCRDVKVAFSIGQIDGFKAVIQGRALGSRG